MKKLCNVFLAFALGLFFSCSSTDDVLVFYSGECGAETIINTDFFENAEASFHIVSNPEIIGDCFQVSFSGSGCSGDDWQVELVDSGMILESFPPQRNLRFVFINSEECDAFITRELSFDIALLQVDGSQVNLAVEGLDHFVNYQY